jgi:hypothetical protein
MKITITYCGGNYTELVSNHRTDDRDTAIRRAITKHWTPLVSFWKDKGISTDNTWYGQMVRPSKLGGMDCITQRVSIEWEEAS